MRLRAVNGKAGMYALEVDFELTEEEAEVLVAAFEKVRINERKRIIALLESISFLEDYPPFNHTIVTEEAIALIKGEKE